MATVRSTNLMDKPAAKAWREQYPEATQNLDRVLELLIERYRGNSHGYINRANKIEYRFSNAPNERRITGVRVLGSQTHIKVRFQLFKASARAPFKSEAHKDHIGNPTVHDVDVDITPTTSLDELRRILDKTHTFAKTVQKSNSFPKIGIDDFEHSQNTGTQAIYDPHSPQEGKKMTLQAASIRLGQPEFRRKLLRHYGNTCLISRCTVLDVLEAAHITPYDGRGTNEIGNGLLLRADLHTLWDRKLLAIDTRTFKVWVARRARGNYDDLHGLAVNRTLLKGAILALKAHWEDISK